MMQSSLFDISIWTSPLVALVLTYLYFRYYRFGKAYGGGLIVIYGIHQTFCLLFLIQSLGTQIISSLLVGPILVLDLIFQWPKKDDNEPNQYDGNRPKHAGQGLDSFGCGSRYRLGIFACADNIGLQLVDAGA